jgi:hypothetical protein
VLEKTKNSKDFDNSITPLLHYSNTPTLQSPLFGEIISVSALLTLFRPYFHLDDFAPEYFQSLCYQWMF